MSTESRVRALLVPLVPTADTVEATASLAKVGLDSLAALELTLGLEEEFGFFLDDDDLDLPNFETIAAIAAMVDRKLAQ